MNEWLWLGDGGGLALAEQEEQEQEERCPVFGNVTAALPYITSIFFAPRSSASRKAEEHQ